MSAGFVFTGCTVTSNGAPGFLFGREPAAPPAPFLLDEEIITREWPMPLPAPEQKSLWARIWDAIREPFNFGGEL